MGVACHGYVCIWKWSVFAAPYTLSGWAVCDTIGALDSPLLGCSDNSLFHIHVVPVLLPGLACSIRLGHDCTRLSLSHRFQSTPAPADQVVTPRWKCGSDHRSRVHSATVDLPFA